MSGSSASAGGDLWRLEASELAPLIRSGAVSSREAVRSCLDRMDAVNGRLRAVVHRFDAAALADADAADAARRRGDAVGDLCGVPVTVKINTDQRDTINDGGVEAYRDRVAPSDSPVVENLRAAGAVIVGRTNAPAFSMRWHTDNALHGATLNPWSDAVTPGGSSGGAAAAVAAGLGPIAHGNDIGGSIRYPAYCCGVAGLRPTLGRVPSHNESSGDLVAISSQLMAVQGPLARSVEDLRLAFAAMARPSPRDPRFVAPAPAPADPRPLTIAIAPAAEGLDVHPAVQAAVRDAGRALAAAGHRVEEVALPDLLPTAAIWGRLALPDVMAGLQPLIDQKGDEGIRRAVALWREVWPAYGPADALRALAERGAAARRWGLFLSRYRALVLPVSASLPMPVGFDVESAAATERLLAAQAPLLAVSVLGLPALSVPTGLVAGVPVGVQIVADRFREDLCLDLGATIEAEFGTFMPSLA